MGTLIAFIALMGRSGGVAAAPITFNTALPVAQGEFVFRQQFRYLRSGDDPGEADRTLRVAAAISVLGYGVNSKLALFGALPWVDKELEGSQPGTGVDIERHNRGLGDATAFARYTFWQDNAAGRTFRWAGFGGFTAPTASDDKSDSFGRLPPPLQLGAGAWQWFAGLVTTYQTLAYQLDGQLSYRRRGETGDFKAGDEAHLDLSWQYRLWPRTLGGGVPGFFYWLLEFNLLHQQKNQLNGRDDDNSGGDTVWLSPGLQYVTRRWVLEAVLQKPILQQLNGTALENDLIVSAP